MKVLNKLNRKDALKLLRGNIDPENDEFCWFKCHSDYLIKNGRNNVSEIILNNTEVKNLIASDNNRGDKNKINSFVEKIKNEGYSNKSYLFLRDLNDGEIGSYYVENGVHRTQALQKCLVQGIRFAEVRAVLFSK